MDKELKKAVRKSKVAMQAELAKERESFKTLLLKNPNYFGNLIDSPFKPIKAVCCNTYYEELVCVGFQTQQEFLEAVVYVYQPSGYGTGVCGNGTTEFVRFYLSHDNGASWQDQGLTSFQAHNIPEGTKGSDRLEYATSLKVNPPNHLCFLGDHLIQVRAILSWNSPPPANQPNWKPVWGNVLERNIQTEPLNLIFTTDLLASVGAKVPTALADILADTPPIPLEKKSLEVADLARMYDDKGVPIKRFAFKELHSFVTSQSQLSVESVLELVPGITPELDIDDLVLVTDDGDGDTSYEEMHCIGLDPNDPNVLVAVLEIKKTAGYSGGPCTDGSKEYVSFWGDFNNNGTFETFLGTTSVQVYDLPNVPNDGVHYAVRLPVDLSQYRKPCHDGPVVIPIRAIMSWNVPAPGNNPNYVPTWGNREETLIHISPLGLSSAGKIAILGGIPTGHIHDLNGVTTPSAVFATNNLAPDSLGRPCPFAGRVSVQGAPVLGHSYKVEVVPVGGGVPVPVVKDLVLTRFDGTTWTHTANPATGRFNYVPFWQNVNGLMAQWDTSGDDLWIVRLLVYNAGGILVGVDSHRIQLDNTAPVASIEITSGTGDCGKFTIGEVITGNFVARDAWFGHYSLGVEPPVNPAGTFLLTPTSGNVQTPVAGSAWSLDTNGVPDTAGMQSCGYVIHLWAVDRAIRNSQSVGHWVPATVGFCLEE